MSKRLAISVAPLCAALLISACTGDKGDPGENGANGVRGVTGATGANGQDGMAGTAGMNGMDGMDGQDGMNGMNGQDGQTLTLSARASRGFEISPVPIDMTTLTATGAERVGRGSYLINAQGGCDDCHANQQPAAPPRYLGGGTPFPLPGGAGVVYARNLTTHPTNGLRLTEDEFVSVMRTGVDHKNPGESLLVMPWFNFRWMTEADIRAMYAYLVRIPAVDNPVPPDIKGPFAAVPPVPYPSSFADGDEQRTLPPESVPDPDNVRRGLAIHPLAMPAEVSAADADESTVTRFGRGSYIVNAVSGCNDCHTNPMRDFNPAGATYLKINTAGFLSGGGVFEVPPGLNAAIRQRYTMASNLSGETNSHLTNFTNFLETITEGTHIAPNGARRPLGWPMPYGIFRNMTIEDLAAVYTYIRLVPRRTGANDKVTQGPARFCTLATDCRTGETCSSTGECEGGDCTAITQCGACQECNNVCVATATTSACHTTGI